MRSDASKTERGPKADPPADLIEWDMLRHTGSMTPAELRSMAAVFARWSDQCQRYAAMRENGTPHEARN